MTAKQEREAHELIGFLGDAVKYPNVAKLVRKPLLARATKLLKRVDGTTHNELEIAVANVKGL